MSCKRDLENPWGATTSETYPGGEVDGVDGCVNKTLGTKRGQVSLALIMAQQEEERVAVEQVREMKRLEEESRWRLAAEADGESEDERQLRLAIEASLRDVGGGGDGPEKRDTVASVHGKISTADQDMVSALHSSRIDSALDASAAETRKDDSSEGTSCRNTQKEMGLSGAESSSGPLSAEEMEQIEQALRDSENKSADEAASLDLALKLQREEEEMLERERIVANSDASNVRVVHREDFRSMRPHCGVLNEEEYPQGGDDEGNEYLNYIDCYDDDDCFDEFEDSGYRINPAPSGAATWRRIGSSGGQTIMNRRDGEVRTKHDTELKNRSNAHRMGLSKGSSVSDTAYNAFRNKVKRGTIKGMARTGTGRAENMSRDRTREGALDGVVRDQVRRAINTGTINRMNGAVKEGKEAIVYHADGPGGGLDVAVKVFKRIQEFRQRGMYVDGDPRYSQKFNTLSKREQIEVWAEKEYRNLVRAHAAGVPCPKPILHKYNILFMSFLGEDGWPAPQLREVEMKRGSKRWAHLYAQTIVAVRRLFHCACLIHGDLSEYNILLCPSFQINSRAGTDGDGEDTSLEVALIDFGQAIHVGHPSADDFLRRDLERVNSFFRAQGTMVLGTEKSYHFVLEPFDLAGEKEGEGGRSNDMKKNKAEATNGADVDTQEVEEGFVLVEEESNVSLARQGDGKESRDASVDGDGSAAVQVGEGRALLRPHTERPKNLNKDSDAELPCSSKWGAKWRKTAMVWDEERDYNALQLLLASSTCEDNMGT